MAALYWATAARCFASIGQLLDDNRTKILINLADVNYIDSSGIGELVHATRRENARRRAEAAASQRRFATCYRSPNFIQCLKFIRRNVRRPSLTKNAARTMYVSDWRAEQSQHTAAFKKKWPTSPANHNGVCPAGMNF